MTRHHARSTGFDDPAAPKQAPAAGRPGLGETGEPEVVVRVPADASWLALVRSVAFGVGMRADLDMDAVEDLKMAVDEACAQLVVLAAPGTELVGTFGLTASGVRVALSVPAGRDNRVRQGSFGWHVLSVLTDELELTEDAQHTSGGTMATITLAKHRDTGRSDVESRS